MEFELYVRKYESEYWSVQRDLIRDVERENIACKTRFNVTGCKSGFSLTTFCWHTQWLYNLIHFERSTFWKRWIKWTYEVRAFFFIWSSLYYSLNIHFNIPWITLEWYSKDFIHTWVQIEELDWFTRFKYCSFLVTYAQFELIPEIWLKTF